MSDLSILSPLVTVNPDLSPVSELSPIVSPIVYHDVQFLDVSGDEPIVSYDSTRVSGESSTLVDSAIAHPKCLGHRCVFPFNPDYVDDVSSSDDFVVILSCDSDSHFVVSKPQSLDSEDYIFRFIPNGVSLGIFLPDNDQGFDHHTDYMFMSQPVSEGDGDIYCLSSYDIKLTGI